MLANFARSGAGGSWRPRLSPPEPPASRRLNPRPRIDRRDTRPGHRPGRFRCAVLETSQPS